MRGPVPAGLWASVCLLVSCRAPGAAGGSQLGQVESFESELLQQQQQQGQGSQGRATGSAALSGAQSPLCWHSAWWHISEEEQKLRRQAGSVWQAEAEGGVMVYGAGCWQCMQGQPCSFLVSVLPPARWETPPGSAFKRELMITLLGPARHHVSLAPHPTRPHTLLATYLTWDPGTYEVRVRVSCSTLRYDQGTMPSHSHDLPPWQLTVLPASGPGPNGAAGGTPLSSLWLIQAPFASQPDSTVLLQPCLTSLHARWLLVQGEYRWTPYACAPRYSLLEVPQLLAGRGIREMSFVGDSHVRLLLLHSLFLLTGETHPELHKARWDFTLALPLSPRSPSTSSASSATSLKLNFYWVDGVYRNGEHGCKNRGQYSNRTSSFPDISSSTDVTVVSSGYWAGAFCSEAELAVAEHLPHFLHHVTKQGAAKPGSRIVFRSIPPFFTLNHCTQATNTLFAFSNAFARGLCERLGLQFFNAWEVESPRFLDICGKGDPHYSCFGGTQRQPIMTGPVGEAVARSFIHYLLHIMP